VVFSECDMQQLANHNTEGWSAVLALASSTDLRQPASAILDHLQCMRARSFPASSGSLFAWWLFIKDQGALQPEDVHLWAARTFSAQGTFRFIEL